MADRSPHQSKNSRSPATPNGCGRGGRAQFAAHAPAAHLDPTRIEESRSAPHPDHHLWRNGRLWWVAFTVHLPGWRKERIRRSLGTADRREARLKRDLLFRCWDSSGAGAMSVRFVPREVGR